MQSQGTFIQLHATGELIIQSDGQLALALLCKLARTGDCTATVSKGIIPVSAHQYAGRHNLLGYADSGLAGAGIGKSHVITAAEHGGICRRKAFPVLISLGIPHSGAGTVTPYDSIGGVEHQLIEAIPQPRKRILIRPGKILKYGISHHMYRVRGPVLVIIPEIKGSPGQIQKSVGGILTEFRPHVGTNQYVIGAVRIIQHERHIEHGLIISHAHGILCRYGHVERCILT